ncbi:MAG: ATP-binding cassette domain-containing protein [Deltaproteobacteria bacterium]|nr:ATP-binding cassette domain-containing protein [Deltaproteobacteria bacterium]
MADVVIRIVDLVKNFGRLQAVAGVSLEVLRGEIFAYLGPNGSGKTTTIRILAGLSRASGGKAWLNGFSVEHESLAARQQVGIVPQTSNLDQELTVFENLEIHRRLFGLGREKRRRIDELLDYFALVERRNALVRELSGGLKRRLMMARALLHEPAILFLDEPTVGLDPGIRRQLWALIKRVQQDGVTVFLTTHYIEEAEFLADRVAFLEQGRLVALDRPQRLVARLGEWALDRAEEGRLESFYFPSREAATAAAAALTTPCNLRRVNLEDAFLQMTGKKINNVA